MRQLCCFIYFLLGHILLSAAQAPQKFPIKNLLQDSLPIASISLSSEHLLPIPESDEMKKNAEAFIKNGKYLYVFVDGSRRLYKASLDNNGMYAFTRIDSTTHFGYNIAAFPFSYNNHIYNFGGYGLWRINGQLRVFNEKAHEWDIVKLNKEIPFMAESSLLWYDIKGKKIYIGLYSPKNEAEKSNVVERDFIYDVMVLDLTKMEWTKAGSLNPSIIKNLPVTGSVASSPWGLLANMGNKFTLIDYTNNQLLSLDASKEDYQTIQRKGAGRNFYFKDSMLFFGSNINMTLDSIQLHYSDFKPTGETIFSVPTLSSKYSTKAIILFVVVALLLIMFLLFKKYFFISVKKKDTVQLTEPSLIEPKETIVTKPEQESTSINEKLFDEKEIQLLELLLENSSTGKFTTIDELNTMLGVSRKPPEIQKKQRSDTITSINRKYSVATKIETALIEKNRTDFDRRSFEYFINPENLVELRKLLPHKDS